MTTLHRLRADGVAGALSDALTASTGDTAMQSDGLIDLPAVASPDYAALTLFITDAAGRVTQREVVYVTAHTASDNDATVLRAQEGTTAQAWSIGDKFVHAPTSADYVDGIDYPWTGDLGYDINSWPSSTPAGWAFTGVTGSSYRSEYGASVVEWTAASGDNTRALVRNLPSEGTWEATAKVTQTAVNRSNAVGYGLVIMDSSSGKMILAGFFNNAGDEQLTVMNMTNSTTYSAHRSGFPEKVVEVPHYFRWRKNSSTSWDFEYSTTGCGFRKVMSAVNITDFLTTPDKIGFYGNQNGADQQLVACHWFRVR